VLLSGNQDNGTRIWSPSGTCSGASGEPFRWVAHFTGHQKELTVTFQP